MSKKKKEGKKKKKKLFPTRKWREQNIGAICRDFGDPEKWFGGDFREAQNYFSPFRLWAGFYLRFVFKKQQNL